MLSYLLIVGTMFIRVYLVFMFIQLIFRHSNINDIYFSLFVLEGPMFFDNEGWTILGKVVCHMFFKVYGYKNSLFCWCDYKDIQLICPISVKVLINIRNSIDTLSKLLTCVFSYFGRSSSCWVFLFNIYI